MNIHAFLLQPLINDTLMFFDYPLAILISGYGVGILIACILMNWIYIKRLFVREVPPPISVFVLWFLLDAIATGSDFAHGVCNIQMIGFTLGTMLTIFALIFRLNLSWSGWDTFTAFLVTACLTAVYITNDWRVSFIFSVSAMAAASIPMVFAIIVTGADEPPITWFISLVVSILNFFDDGVPTTMITSDLFGLSTKAITGMLFGVIQFVMVILILYFAHKRKMLASRT